MLDLLREDNHWRIDQDGQPIGRDRNMKHLGAHPVPGQPVYAAIEDPGASALPARIVPIPVTVRAWTHEATAAAGVVGARTVAGEAPECQVLPVVAVGSPVAHEEAVLKGVEQGTLGFPCAKGHSPCRSWRGRGDGIWQSRRV